MGDILSKEKYLKEFMDGEFRHVNDPGRNEDTNESLEFIDTSDRLIKERITDAMEWSKEFVKKIEEHKLSVNDIDEGLMVSWFSSAMMTMHDSVLSKVEKEIEILRHFPLGCYVESTIGEGGPSEAFFNCGFVQPFSYLDDYSAEHFRIVENPNE